MSPLGIVWQVIGWLSLPVLAVLAVILSWRRSFREFPYFFSYIVASVLVGFTRLAALRMPGHSYFYTYWTSDVLLGLFALLATFELLLRRLFPGFHKIGFYRFLFSAAAVCIPVAAVPAALRSRNLLLVVTVTHIMVVVRVAILFFLVALMILMGRRWRRYEFSVALGLAVGSAALLMTFALWTKSTYVRSLIDQLSVVGYDLACLIWLVGFLGPEKKPLPPPDELIDSNIVSDARRSEQELKIWLKGRKGSPEK